MSIPRTASPTPGSTLHGFTVRRVVPLPDWQATAFEFLHDRTGARMLHVLNDDPENLFSINFPTPPPDDTGLPHILEHCVLAGSRRFPVRDPFFEMYKMSMATFINAMTGVDCTYYPVCSNVRKDLFNLAEVYFDAVFHPLLSKETFEREGHHLAPADPEQPTGPLTVRGIVFNEMKAAYSRPEARLWRSVVRTLCPDNGYGRDSGGDPEAIPELTYEDFRAFHARWYHPSNARIVCYGDIEPAAWLRWLEPRLADFTSQPAEAEYQAQPRWSAPRQVDDTYDAGQDATTARTFLALAWLAPGGLDCETVLLLSVLERILFGDDAAPVRRAVIDAHLGTDLVGTGTSSLGHDSMISVGLRGSEPDRLEAFQQVVLQSLETLCTQGVDPELVESAFRRTLYDVREIQSMRPLNAARDILTSWNLGGDPLLYLDAGAVLESCRTRCREQPEILAGLIRTMLLDNPHRVAVRLAPEVGWQQRIDGSFAARMAAIREGLDDETAAHIAAHDAELQRQAGEPNSPEALASLPQLRRDDLPAEPARLPTAVEQLPEGLTLLRNDVFSNGVNYLALDIDLEGLDPRWWHDLPLVVEVINRMGAADMDYAATARRVSAATGQFFCHASFGAHCDAARPTSKSLAFALKALDEQIEPALELLRDKLNAPRPDERDRLRDVVTQLLARLEAGLVNGGPRAAELTLRSSLTEAGHLSECTGGRTLQRRIKDLGQGFDARVEQTVETVLRIAAALRNPARLTASFTGSDNAAGRVRVALADLARGWPPGAAPTPAATGFAPADDPLRLGLVAPVQVAHCVQMLRAPHRSHPDAPLLQLGMALLRVDYMVSELRFKGHAYGAHCSYGGDTITLSTYADPHIVRTLDVFAGLPAYVREAPWSDVELTRGIISCAREFVRPIRPEQATHQALAHHVTGNSHEQIRTRYETIRTATPSRLKEALLAVLEAGLPRAPVAVVANRDALEAANRARPEAPLSLEALLA